MLGALEFAQLGDAANRANHDIRRILQRVQGVPNLSSKTKGLGCSIGVSLGYFVLQVGVRASVHGCLVQDTGRMVCLGRRSPTPASIPQLRQADLLRDVIVSYERARSALLFVQARRARKSLLH